jgi:mono/diheme cytochrome c family protein
MRLTVLASAILSLPIGGAALAATIPGQPNPAHGKALAESLCTNCHLVAPDQDHASADVPSFHEIANLPGQTTGDIIARIMLPKHPMPRIPLTNDELADLAAYIISLRNRP